MEVGGCSSNKCMNAACSGESTPGDWKRGWPLRSGQFSTLCSKCGSAFEQSNFCDVFHSQDSGWRECTSCGKRLHCGCIASRLLLELLDGGGVNCASCAKTSGLIPMQNEEKGSEFGRLRSQSGEMQSSSTDNLVDGDEVDKVKARKLETKADDLELRYLQQSGYSYTNGSVRQSNEEEGLAFVKENGSSSEPPNGSAIAVRLDSCNEYIGARTIDDGPLQTDLNIFIGAHSGISSRFAGAVTDERDFSKIVSSQSQGQISHHLLPKPPRPFGAAFEPTASNASQVRIARPPAEGRGRSQLLPRYWPRITDQELQQISGDSNSTIVPLFEKVLSASDAGRIGRLVLPKACAEAYFPQISQPEGLPLRIQDVRGKEWMFQFRFWPNNNSRMYVLEGVTPCIQSMQLQAGDTVTFSRMDPEGKLVMGFRKASASTVPQESQLPSLSNGNHTSGARFTSGVENLSTLSGYSGILQSLKGSTDPRWNALSKHLNSSRSDLWWQNIEKNEGVPTWIPPMMGSEKKRARNIGSKSKRLLIDSQDAMELKMTWEEVQDLLRSPPSIQPTFVTIEDYELEEYDAPPVFGKRSFFIVRSPGGQEQWVQCDSCAKWRRLPVDVLLPPVWTCADNIWDQSRCSCSAPDGLSPQELETFVRLEAEHKRRKLDAALRLGQENEPGPDALANAVMVGDSAGDPGTISIAATTKHPRHRAGCSCIVCIQPPSGKGKHKPTCDCTVCMTVKRRFKTMMMRKKKRQSEREAELAPRKVEWGLKDEIEVDSSPGNTNISLDSQILVTHMAGTGRQKIDLNFQPGGDRNLKLGLDRTSMMNLVREASQPLETYMKQNGLVSLVAWRDEAQDTNEVSEGQIQEDCYSEVDAIEKEEVGKEDDEEDNDNDAGEGDSSSPEDSKSTPH
ncbi:hypothetical protein MLD38_001480 [Melastoma candidum]|uniref:Uncharacterized protein n=1 Tax=Melastoma candidum TaxID=119954 RepID=A0ACB9SDB5_9MYRT|nr:hypothetical protein MLD38_001480 [Melastoma candidum]